MFGVMTRTHAKGPGRLRLIDPGPRTAAQNLALDAALLELRAAGSIPDTLRFIQFSPAAALIGFHQTVEREIRIDYCRRHGIDVNRRTTGGGAIFVDCTQLGWEIVAARASLGAGCTLEDMTRRLCAAVVAGLRRLGIDAAFRPRNDIEVGGRKISGTGGSWEGDVFLFQGTLLIGFDPDAMMRALRIPVEKLARHEVESVGDRVTSISRELPGRTPTPGQIKAALIGGFKSTLGWKIEAGTLTGQEMELASSLLQRFTSKAWLHDTDEPAGDSRQLTSFHQGAGGTLHTTLSLDLTRRRIRSVLFTGDYFVSPRRAVYDLEACLKDCDTHAAVDEIERFFARSSPDFLGLDQSDFSAGLKACLNKVASVDLGIPMADTDSLSLVNAEDIGSTVASARVLLLPYCAKPLDCEYRQIDACDLCGECDVGQAYSLAHEKGMLPVSICDYRHLEAVLGSCREQGVESFIGCCCQGFLAKRLGVFAEAGVPGVILDIDDTTCYELEQEDAAFAGAFERQTRLKTTLLERLIARVDDHAVR